MIGGPRVGRQTWLRRAMASVLGRKLDAFVVPGAELLTAVGLDADRAGLRLVANPRHANVLLLIGEIPPGLAHAAAVAHAQQPRPRAILSVGTTSSADLLPQADVSVEANQAALAAGVANLRRLIAMGAWTPHPAPSTSARRPAHTEPPRAACLAREPHTSRWLGWRITAS
jgi:hypothetical protein